jgi:DNA invertase Pin-like site-specific DNA recombinase
VEVIAMFSNRSDQGRSLRKLLRRPPSGPKPVRTRTARKTARRLSSPDVHALVEAYGAGSSIYELARQFGIHRSTVSAILERKGVSRRYRLLEDDRLDRAVELYAAGKSLTDVGAALGVNRSTVALALKKSGASLRPRPGWSY